MVLLMVPAAQLTWPPASPTITPPPFFHIPSLVTPPPRGVPEPGGGGRVERGWRVTAPEKRAHGGASPGGTPGSPPPALLPGGTLSL